MKMKFLLIVMMFIIFSFNCENVYASSDNSEFQNMDITIDISDIVSDVMCSEKAMLLSETSNTHKLNYSFYDSNHSLMFKITGQLNVKYLDGVYVTIDNVNLSIVGYNNYSCSWIDSGSILYNQTPEARYVRNYRMINGNQYSTGRINIICDCYDEVNFYIVEY